MNNASPDRPAPILRGLLLAALPLAAFAALVWAVRVDALAGFDRAVLLAFRDPADPAKLLGPRWLPQTLRDLTSLGSVLVIWLVTALVAVYFALTRKWGDLLLVLAAVGGGQALGSSLKHLVARARPDLIPDAPQVFTASFPSGHALLSAVAYLAIGSLLSTLDNRRRLKGFYIGTAVALTIAIGTSRVALGVHWPTDVLAGWCLGASWAAICAIVAAHLRRRHAAEPLG